MTLEADIKSLHAQGLGYRRIARKLGLQPWKVQAFQPPPEPVPSNTLADRIARTERIRENIKMMPNRSFWDE